MVCRSMARDDGLVADEPEVQAQHIISFSTTE